MAPTSVSLRDVARQNGAALRAFRQMRGLSAADLAQRVDVTDPHIRNLENEHRSAQPELLAKIALVLDVPEQALKRLPDVVREAVPA